VASSCRTRGRFYEVCLICKPAVSRRDRPQVPSVPCAGQVFHDHWYSTTAAMAATSSSITADGKFPNFFMNREVSTPLSCRASIEEVFERPFLPSGSTRTCQMLPLKWSFHSVMGAINRRGSRPSASELTITAGRFFCISEPTVGSKLTSQISPRFGDGGLVLNEVSTLEIASFCALRIV